MSRHLELARRHPHPMLSIGAAAGACAALYPGLLPRSTAVTVMVTCGGVIAGILVALAFTRLVFTRFALTRDGRLPSARARHIAHVASALVLIGAIVLHVLWQNMIRADLGVSGTPWEYGPAVACAALLTYGALTYLPRLSATVGVVLVGVVAGLMTTAPAAPARPSTAVGTPVPAAPPILAASGTDQAAAASLVHHWEERRALASTPHSAPRRAVVIAVPTGSGWVDPRALAAISTRLHGNVDVLSLRYASMSSWRAFVTDRDAAARSAISLLRMVIEHQQHEPFAARAPIYLYGQSLGALGADRAREWAQNHYPGAVSGTLLAGVPADTVARTSSSPRVVVANASDPVANWSTAALWRPPGKPADTRIVGRHTRIAPWLPVITFVQTSIDLLTALDGPAGTGHRYGAEQGLLPAAATPVEVNLAQPIGPRAASYAAPTR